MKIAKIMGSDQHISKHMASWGLGLLFTVGLCLAGSEGEWFPWANFGGIGLLVLMAIPANRIFPKREPYAVSREPYTVALAPYAVSREPYTVDQPLLPGARDGSSSVSF